MKNLNIHLAIVDFCMPPSELIDLKYLLPAKL